MVVSNSKYGNDKRAFGKNRAYLASVPTVPQDELADEMILDPELPAVGMDLVDFEIPRYGEMQYILLEELEE